jgi:xylose isomerase
MRHFDAHAYRTETLEGVWDFARGCMRTYLILREKCERFRADAEIQAALADAMVESVSTPAIAGAHDADAIAALRRGPHDLEAMAARGYGHERLDQLVTELLLGVR